MSVVDLFIVPLPAPYIPPRPPFSRASISPAHLSLDICIYESTGLPSVSALHRTFQSPTTKCRYFSILSRRIRRVAAVGIQAGGLDQ